MELINFKKKNPACYFPAERMEFFADRCIEITGKDIESLKTFSDFVDLAIETALGQTKHLSSEVSELRKEHDKLFEQSVQLATKKVKLENELHENLQVIESLKAEIISLKKDAETNIELISELTKDSFSKHKLNENQYIIELNSFKKQLFDKIAKDEQVIKLAKRLNNNTKFDGLIENLNGTNEIQNIVHMLSNLVIYFEMNLLQIISVNEYPHQSIIGKEKVQKAFFNYKNS